MFTVVVGKSEPNRGFIPGRFIFSSLTTKEENTSCYVPTATGLRELMERVRERKAGRRVSIETIGEPKTCSDDRLHSIIGEPLTPRLDRRKSVGEDGYKPNYGEEDEQHEVRPLCNNHFVIITLELSDSPSLLPGPERTLLTG